MLIRGGVTVAALFLLGLLWLMTARRVAELIDAVATVHVKGKQTGTLRDRSW